MALFLKSKHITILNILTISVIISSRWHGDTAGSVASSQSPWGQLALALSVWVCGILCVLLVFMWVSFGFSQEHAVRWISNNDLPLGVNKWVKDALASTPFKVYSQLVFLG